MSIRDEMREAYPEALLLAGFDDALIGFGTQFTHDLAIYSFDRCVEILVERDGLTEEEAIEYLEFNSADGWVGEHTPVFLRDEP